MKAGHSSFSFILLLAFTVGCNPVKESANTGEIQARQFDSVHRELDELYRIYLTNDIQSVKEPLYRSLQIIEASKNRKVAESGLWLTYARLYCVERALGNTNAAQFNYEMSRLWLSNYLEALETLTGKRDERLRSFTPAECGESALEWDRVFTQGKGPRFIQQERAVGR